VTLNGHVIYSQLVSSSTRSLWTCFTELVGPYVHLKPLHFSLETAINGVSTVDSHQQTAKCLGLQYFVVSHNSLGNAVDRSQRFSFYTNGQRALLVSCLIIGSSLLRHLVVW